MQSRSEKFFQKANEIHPTLDFSLAEYVNNKVPITIVCPSHGEFTITPTALTNKRRGCPKCTTGYYEPISFDEFTRRARTIHGEKYGYLKDTYTTWTKKITIACPEHGKFQQTAREHAEGANCPKCVGGVSKDMTYYIRKFRETHGDKYQYDVATFVNSKTPMRMISPTHGEFMQTPEIHIRGALCPKEHKNAPVGLDVLQTRLSEKYGDKYSIDNKNGKTIHGICTEHGKFKTTITSINSGIPCKECSKEHRRLSIEEMTDRLKQHPDYEKYTFHWDTFIGTLQPMKVECNEHGVFYPRMNGFMREFSRCPTCAGKNSLAEQEVYEFVNSLVGGWERSDRTICKPYELDMVHHEKKIAIEYNGIRWHSEHVGGKDKTYHISKLNQAESEGYNLLTIFEDEWINTPWIVKSRIKSILGFSKRSVGARHLCVKVIDNTTAREFLSQYHIQNAGSNASIRYGAYHGEELVAVMTFGKARAALGSSGKLYYELLRFATDGKSYAGIASKLFKRFIKDHNPKEVVSYADRRWSKGGLYERLGFVKDKDTTPNYWYFKKSTIERKHRYGFRKNVLVDKFGANPDLSEWQNMKLLGYDRIWDCGNHKYTWSCDLR